MSLTVAPPPSPAPSTTPWGVTTWTCNDRSSPSPYPTTTPVPQADALPATPYPTTATVQVKTGQDCAATGYGPMPALTVGAVPTPQVALTVAAQVTTQPLPQQLIDDVHRLPGFVIPALAVLAFLVAAAVGLWLRR